MNVPQTSTQQSGSRSQISHVALGNVALVFASLAFVSFVFSSLVAYIGNLSYPPGLIAVIAAVCFICVLAAVFGRRASLLWASPVLVIWAVVFALHFLDIYSPDPMTPRPLPVNVMINLVAALAAVSYVNSLLNRRTDQIVESEEAERRAVARELQLQRSLRSERERFMGELSHEIRTPVAALRNAVTLIKNPKASPAMKDKYIDVVDVTSASLLTLLNDALFAPEANAVESAGKCDQVY